MKTHGAEVAAFDAAEFLDTPERVAAYLEDALADPEPTEFIAALGVVARAKGMTDIASAAGVTRPALYRSLSAGGRPDFGTVVRVLRAVGLSVHVEAVERGGEEAASFA